MNPSVLRNDCEYKQADQVAREILAVLLPRRRTTEADGPTPDDWPVQLAAIRAAVKRRIPIDFIIPGFPCKSPNPAKVCGTLPDEAERVALHILDEICSRISHVHPPGARVTICSDGHVFTDVIGVDDETIVEYNDALVKIIADEGLSHLSTFDLREIWGDGDFAAKRRQLDTQWAPALDDIRADVKAGGDSARLLRGMTRFMIADTVDWSGTKSQLQKDAKQRAYQLIRFSAAWGNILDTQFPEAVRLSIHPQPRLSPKLGIKMIAPDDDIWTTPWHSVLVYDTSGRPRLTSHAEARAKYVPVHQDGRLSHFIEKPRSVLPSSSGSPSSALMHAPSRVLRASASSLTRPPATRRQSTY